MSSMEETYGIPLPDSPPKPTAVQRAIAYMEDWISDGPVISPADIRAAIADLQADGGSEHG